MKEYKRDRKERKQVCKGEGGKKPPHHSFLKNIQPKAVSYLKGDFKNI